MQQEFSITEPQNEFWKGISGRRKPAGCPRNRWDEEVRKYIKKFFSMENGAQRQHVGISGEKTELAMARKRAIRRRNNGGE